MCQSKGFKIRYQKEMALHEPSPKLLRPSWKHRNVQEVLEKHFEHLTHFSTAMKSPPWCFQTVLEKKKTSFEMVKFRPPTQAASLNAGKLKAFR